MTPEERERMNTLYREIQVESDPARFVALMEELTQLLTQKERSCTYYAVLKPEPQVSQQPLIPENRSNRVALPMKCVISVFL